MEYQALNATLQIMFLKDFQKMIGTHHFKN